MSRPRRPAQAPLDRVLATLNAIATAERDLAHARAARRTAFADLRAATERFHESQAPDDEAAMLAALAAHRQTVDDCRVAEADLDAAREAHNPIF